MGRGCTAGQDGALFTLAYLVFACLSHWAEKRKGFSHAPYMQLWIMPWPNDRVLSQAHAGMIEKEEVALRKCA